MIRFYLFWTFLGLLLLALLGCEPEYRKETQSVEDIEKNVSRTFAREEKERKSKGGFSKTTSQEDDTNFKSSNRKVAKKTTITNKYGTIGDLESEAESEVRLEPAKTTIKKIRKPKPIKATFSKTKKLNPDVYIPSEDNERLRSRQENAATAIKLRGEAPSKTVTPEGIIIAHPRRPYPPSKYVLLWTDEYEGMKLKEKYTQKLEFGPYSRFKFYQEFGAKRWYFDWIDVSLELNELPTSLVGWRNSEKQWKPKDNSGEKWDYGQGWAYEEDKWLKIILAKSTDAWAFKDEASRISVAYCLFHFGKDRVELYYDLRTEMIDPAVSIVSFDKATEPFGFERFFEFLDKTLPSKKNSNSPSK